LIIFEGAQPVGRIGALVVGNPGVALLSGNTQDRWTGGGEKENRLIHKTRPEIREVVDVTRIRNKRGVQPGRLEVIAEALLTREAASEGEIRG
jgi:hypothetical protein